MTITRPITHPNSPPPARNPERGLETITEAITRGITASQGDPSHAGPSLKGGPREGQGLSIRANVDLATYELVSELSRAHGVTIEGVAGLLIARSTAREARIRSRVETSGATTDRTTDIADAHDDPEAEVAAGRPSDPLRPLGDLSPTDPRSMAGAHRADPRTTTEPEVRGE